MVVDYSRAPAEGQGPGWFWGVLSSHCGRRLAGLFGGNLVGCGQNMVMAGNLGGDVVGGGWVVVGIADGLCS
jgi:hypothetical protein